MIHKSLVYRRRMRAKHIQRRTLIGIRCMCRSNLEGNKKEQGRLAKGKIHCSCPLCACKSTKDKGVHTNSLAGYKISDKRKLYREFDA